MGESAPINRQVRTKFAMKIDQVSCAAHHLRKIEVQGARISAAWWTSVQVGGSAHFRTMYFGRLFFDDKRPAPVNPGWQSVRGERRARPERRSTVSVACSRRPGPASPVPCDRAPPPGRASLRGRCPVPREHALRAPECAFVDKPSASVCSFLDQKPGIAKDLNRQDCVVVFPASNITARPIKACNSPVNHCAVFRLRMHPRRPTETGPPAFNRRSRAPESPAHNARSHSWRRCRLR